MTPYPNGSFSFLGGSKLGNKKNVASGWVLPVISSVVVEKSRGQIPCSQLKGYVAVCAHFNSLFICASDCAMNCFISDQVDDLEASCQTSCAISFWSPLISK